MKKTFFILPLLLVLIFSSCSDDSINLAGTTWTSTKDWYGKTRLSFEEGTPYLRPFFAISFGLKSFTIYNVADDNEDLEYEWKETVWVTPQRRWKSLLSSSASSRASAARARPGWPIRC